MSARDLSDPILLELVKNGLDAIVDEMAIALVRTAYSWGARNVELHIAQSTLPGAATQGVVFPTFMPETA